MTEQGNPLLLEVKGWPNNTEREVIEKQVREWIDASGPLSLDIIKRLRAPWEYTNRCELLFHNAEDASSWLTAWHKYRDEHKTSWTTPMGTRCYVCRHAPAWRRQQNGKIYSWVQAFKGILKDDALITPVFGRRVFLGHRTDARGLKTGQALQLGAINPATQEVVVNWSLVETTWGAQNVTAIKTLHEELETARLQGR